MEQIGVKSVFDNAGFNKGVDQYEKGLGKAAKSTEKATEQVNGIGQAFQKLAAGAFIFKASQEMLRFGIESFNAASKVERLSKATDAMALSLDTSGDAMVSAISKASRGTISQAEAFQAANKAMMFGVVQNEEEMAKLTEIAITLGAAMGQDAGKSLDDFSTALGRQSRMILDNLGIIMDQEKAYSMYADTLGRS